MWKAVLSFEESCYYKCKTNILPLHFFSLNIAVGIKIWQSRCRTGPQPAWHRELRSFASNKSGFPWLGWGSRQGSAHPHCLSLSDSACTLLVAFSALICPRFAFSNEAEGKAALFSQTHGTPVLHSSVAAQGSDFSTAGYLIWPPSPSFQQIIYMVLLFVSSSHVYIVPRSF